MTEQEKTQISLTPFAKGGNRFLVIYFHPNLVQLMARGFILKLMQN
jgi:hypothetical protein